MRAINNQGEIIGTGYIYRDGVARPFTAIGAPRDLNDLGQIVGSSDLTGAMLYTNGRTIDLNDAVPYNSGFFLDEAVKINNAGQILVQATVANGRSDWLLLQPQPAAISGSVFNDLNHDGVRESGEAPLAGIRIFVDLNHNGSYDAGEPLAITDTAGDYAISRLNGGTYVVRQFTPSGWFQTTPSNNSAMTISLGAGDHRTAAAFGEAALPTRT